MQGEKIYSRQVLDTEVKNPDSEDLALPRLNRYIAKMLMNS